MVHEIKQEFIGIINGVEFHFREVYFSAIEILYQIEEKFGKIPKSFVEDFRNAAEDAYLNYESFDARIFEQSMFSEIEQTRNIKELVFHYDGDVYCFDELNGKMIFLARTWGLPDEV